VGPEPALYTVPEALVHFGVGPDYPGYANEPAGLVYVEGPSQVVETFAFRRRNVGSWPLAFAAMSRVTLHPVLD
jgi:hypothetical protein